MNIATLLEMAAEGFGDRTAYGPVGGMTFTRLLELSHRAAARFTEAEVEHVAYLTEASPASAVALFGAALAGVPYAPLSYRLSDSALGALMDRLGRSALIADSSRARFQIGDAPVLPPGDLLDPDTNGNAAAALPADGDAVAVLLFTSGTSGSPKAALLRHRNLSSYVLGSVEFGGAGEDEAALVSVPPYHVAGVASVLSAVYSGRRVVHLPSFTPEEWIETVTREHITHAMLVPTMLARVVDVLERDGATLPSLQHLSYGGGRMPLPVIERAMELLPGTSFVNAYGLTETSSTITLLGPDDHRIAFASSDHGVRRRLGSVGRPIDGVEIEIRDQDGARVPSGVSGEVWVRGAQVAGEYAGAHTGAAEDGWFATKDGGVLDSDGYLFVEGRLDDVIVRGGENLSPGEIEDALLQHDEIEEAAVIGAPDIEWGEKVVAFVRVRADALTAADVRAWVTGRLRSSRSPQDVYFVDELPYTDTGKLLRRELRRRLDDSAPQQSWVRQEHA